MKTRYKGGKPFPYWDVVMHISCLSTLVCVWIALPTWWWTLLTVISILTMLVAGIILSYEDYEGRYKYK